MNWLRPSLGYVGLIEPPWRIIRTLSESGPAEPDQLAGMRCGVGPRPVGTLSCMVALGLVMGSQSGADRRAQPIRLTPRRETLIRCVVPLMERKYRALEARWGARLRRSFTPFWAM